jgi:hypothetical protein
MNKKTTTRKTSVKAKRTVASRAATKKTVVSKTKKRQPKGLKHHAKRIYHLTPKFIHGMVAGAFIGIILVTSLGIGSNANALDINTGQDCDAWSIIKCGASSSAEVKNKAAASPYIAAAYAHFGISGDELKDLASNAVRGTVYKDRDGNSEVVVAGRVVATNLKVAARLRVTASDTKVPIGNGRVMFVRGLRSYWSHESGPAYVLMKDGVFQFAILASCGNPISGKPIPPKPTPPVKIQVCDLSTFKIVTINKDDFDATKYSKDTAHCAPPPPPVMIQVCDLSTYQIVTIDETDFDATKYSKDTAHCAPTTPPKLIQVCDLGTYQIVTINENDFDADHYSKDTTHCTPPPTPPETPTPPPVTPTPAPPTTLVNTGPGAIITIAVLSIIGGYIFHIKHLHGKHKKHAHHHSR